MSGLQGFLGDEEEEGAAEQERPVDQTDVQEPEPKAPEQQGENKEPVDPSEHEAPEADGAGPTIPRSAFIKAREDWKAKAVKAETEAAERARQVADMQRQIEEFRKAPPQQPQHQHQPPPQPELPDPAVNPAGYVAALIEHQGRQAQEAIAQERFNVSELLLEQRIGREQLDAVVAEFKALAENDPVFVQQLHRQRDPFGYAYQTVQRARALREVGDDPAAFRAKVEAEVRAKLAAEAASPPPPAMSAAQGRPALPRQQPSLAGVRSVAGRTVEDEGDTPLGDILRR